MQLPFPQADLEVFLDAVADAYRELAHLPMSTEVNFQLGLEGRTVTVIISQGAP